MESCIDQVSEYVASLTWHAVPDASFSQAPSNHMEQASETALVSVYSFLGHLHYLELYIYFLSFRFGGVLRVGTCQVAYIYCDSGYLLIHVGF